MIDEIKTETITYTRKKKAVNKFPITLKIDKILLDQLNEYAAKENKKKVDVVEEALSLYFERVKPI